MNNGKRVIIGWVMLCLLISGGFIYMASHATKPVPLTPEQIRARMP